MSHYERPHFPSKLLLVSLVSILASEPVFATSTRSGRASTEVQEVEWALKSFRQTYGAYCTPLGALTGGDSF